MSDLTEAQANIVQWLSEGNGECVMDRYGGFIAHGERRSPAYAATMLRLVTFGHVEGVGNMRLRLTESGQSFAVKPGNPTHVPMVRDFSDPRIRERYIGDEDTNTDFREERALGTPASEGEE